MQTEEAALDLIWGVEDIATAIGRTRRQASYLLQTGAIPAKKVGDRWVISRSKLQEFFSEKAA